MAQIASRELKFLAINFYSSSSLQLDSRRDISRDYHYYHRQVFMHKCINTV